MQHSCQILKRLEQDNSLQIISKERLAEPRTIDLLLFNVFYTALSQTPTSIISQNCLEGGIGIGLPALGQT